MSEEKTTVKEKIMLQLDGEMFERIGRLALQKSTPKEQLTKQEIIRRIIEASPEYQRVIGF